MSLSPTVFYVIAYSFLINVTRGFTLCTFLDRSMSTAQENTKVSVCLETHVWWIVTCREASTRSLRIPSPVFPLWFVPHTMRDKVINLRDKVINWRGPHTVCMVPVCVVPHTMRYKS